MLAIDILKWPGMNQAFLFSFFLTLVLIGAIIVVGRRRPADRKATWGEAIFGATYVFAVMFIRVCLLSLAVTQRHVLLMS